MYPIHALASGALVLLVGTFAWATNLPMLAPPLGVTAYLCLRDPEAPSSSPRNIVVGHLIGLLVGALAAMAAGVVGEASVVAGPFLFRHAVASALAVAGTAGVTEGLRCPHPPSAATTLVVSLGILGGPGEMASFALGTVATALGAHVLRRGLALPAPRWAPGP